MSIIGIDKTRRDPIRTHHLLRAGKFLAATAFAAGAFAIASPAWSQTPTHNVVISIIGRGKAVSLPAGIDCGTVCTADIPVAPEGTKFSYTATPDPGWTFSHWSAGILCDGGNKSSVCSNFIKRTDRREKFECVFVKQGLFSTTLWDHAGNRAIANLEPDGDLKVHRDSLPSGINFEVKVSETVGSVGMVFSYPYSPGNPLPDIVRLAGAGPYFVNVDAKGVPIALPSRLEKGRASLTVNLYEGPDANSRTLARSSYTIDVVTDSLDLEFMIIGKGIITATRSATVCLSGDPCFISYPRKGYADAVPPKQETFKATAAPGWTFKGWYRQSSAEPGIDGECTTPAPCMREIMEQDDLILARFERPDFVNVSLWDIERKRAVHKLRLFFQMEDQNQIDTLLLDTLPGKFTLTGVPSEPVGSVKLSTLEEDGLDAAAPYYMTADAGGNPVPWRPIPEQMQYVSVQVQSWPSWDPKRRDAGILADLLTQVYFRGKTVSNRPAAKAAPGVPTVRAAKGGVELSLRDARHLNIAWVDVQGKAVSLGWRFYRAGTHSLVFPAGIARGVHVLRITGAGFSSNHRIVSLEGL